MATSAPTRFRTEKEANFICMSRIILNLYTRIIRDILYGTYPDPEHLKKDILRDKKLKERFFKVVENKDIINSFSSSGNYDECDLSLLCSIIRNLCGHIRPTKNWEEFPADGCDSTGDDVLRIWKTRNYMYGHLPSMEIKTKKYKVYIKAAEEICLRLKGFSRGKGYENELREIRDSNVDDFDIIDLKKKLEASLDMARTMEQLVDLLLERSEQQGKDIKDIKKILDRKDDSQLKHLYHIKESKIVVITPEGESVLDGEDSVEKNRLITEVVGNIIEKMECPGIQMVERHFELLCQGKKKRSFKEITGIKFLTFLRNNQEKFCLKQKNQQWFVDIESQRQDKEVKTLSENAKPGERRNSSQTERGDTEVLQNSKFDIPESVASNVGCKQKEAFDLHSNLHGTSSRIDCHDHWETISYPCSTSRREKSDHSTTYERKDAALKYPSTNMDSYDTCIAENIAPLFKRVNNFRKGAFVLVTGKIDIMPKMETLARIPWLCVYDFDVSSRKDGLMSVLENQMCVYPCTWMDEPRFSYHVKQWCLIRGSVREPNTCIAGKVNDWIKTISSKLENNLKTLDQYVTDQTFLKVVVLWPQVIEDAFFIQRFLSKMHEIIDPSPEVFVINLEKNHCSTDEENFLLKQIEPSLIVRTLPNELFSAINKNVINTRRQEMTEYRLPTFDKSNDPGIDEITANHMMEYMDILYMDDISGITFEPQDLMEERKEFLRGGTLKWPVYYANDDAGFFDVKRDQMDSIVKHIEEKCIHHSMSGIIEIYHAPGSGASTLARRILWKLRRRVPCVQLKSSAVSNTSDIAENIKVLSEKTELPILILLEGVEAEVLFLHKQLKQKNVVPIFLYLRRIYQDVKTKKNITSQFHLKEYVSITEASHLSHQYQLVCDDDKVENLETLFESVKKGEKHYVFEFGLTTFLHEFKGIASYVKGYLNLESSGSKPGQKKQLEPHQKMLGYLALTYYYGHSSVPCHLFSKVLKFPSEYILEFEDLPYEIQKLVVLDSQHQHKQHIRICHQLVALEILEQILTRNCFQRLSPQKKELSETACRELKQFCLEFISDMTSKKCSGSDKRRSSIIDTFIRIFIQRSDLDTEDCDNFVKRKPKFSRFITDIEKYSVPTDGIEILQRLTELFPDNASFHAHLGRKYSICSPEEEDKAEKCFKRALELCELESNRNSKEINMDGNATLRMVHHMYGMHYFKRICRRTKNTPEYPFVDMINEVLEYARTACFHFEFSRKCSHIGHEELYGLSGDISVRIEVCSYIKTNRGQESFNVSSKNMEVDEERRFIRESMTHVLHLITHCYSVVEEADFPKDMVNNIRIYRDLFPENVVHSICTTGAAADHEERRRRITGIKLKYGAFDILSLNEIAEKHDIRRIVRMLEENFRDVEHMELSSKGLFESDYKDWIKVIRLSQNDIPYTLKEVLNTVEGWNALLNTPTSKCYHFILRMLFLMSSNQNPKDYFKAKELREEMKKYTSHFSNPKRPMEYLGTGSGIKGLIPAKFMKRTLDANIKEMNVSEGIAMKPRLLKGTIKGPRIKPQTGFIAVDVCNGLYQLDIFFVPIRTREKLVGKSYIGRRVEFILAFNIDDGFEAFNVRQLHNDSCNNCQRNIEFASEDLRIKCKCGNVVNR